MKKKLRDKNVIRYLVFKPILKMKNIKIFESNEAEEKKL